MAKARSPDRIKAENMYLESHGKIKPSEIAKELNRHSSTVRSWKNKDEWEEKLKEQRNKGGQTFNQNAIGNNGGAPLRNHNHWVHGRYSKYLPDEVKDIAKNVNSDFKRTPLDM